MTQHASMNTLVRFWSDIENVERAPHQAIQNDILEYLKWVQDEKARADAAEQNRGTEKWDTARPIDEWHEDIGPVLWWTFPIEEPPYCGTPMDGDWPGYHTHWTPFIIPFTPAPAAPKEGSDEAGEIKRRD